MKLPRSVLELVYYSYYSFLQVVLHWEKDLGALGMPLMPAMITHQTSSTSAPSRQSSVGSTTIAAGGPSRLLGIRVKIKIDSTPYLGWLKLLQYQISVNDLEKSVPNERIGTSECIDY